LGLINSINNKLLGLLDGIDIDVVQSILDEMWGGV